MYFQKKPSKNGFRVLVYVHKDGKTRALPRALTKHLDGKPDWEIEDWVRWYEAVHGLAPKKTFKADLAGLEGLLCEYQGFMRSKGVTENTVTKHTDRLHEVLPLFIHESDYNQWHRLAGKLYAHLEGLKMGANRHNSCNTAFRGFYKWLQFTDRVQHRHDLVLINKPTGYKTTPLKFTLSPEEVLTFVRSCPVYELKLLALTGFFFSLRTLENFALERSSFLAGSKASTLQASLTMIKSGLYGKLLTNVTHYRRADGEVLACPPRKRGGIVACFNEDAAKLFVALIKDRPEGLLIDRHLPGHWMDVWSQKGIKGYTLKDLRRASIYWLGHNSDITLSGLMHHARHNNPTTTARYMRRPEELFDNAGLDELDLEA